MDFKLTKEQELAQELFRSFAETEIKPLAHDMDESEVYDMELLQKIKNEFPTAFVLKENINYPPADRQRTYIVDTVRVTRPVAR